jgi:hypothetical protein
MTHLECLATFEDHDHDRISSHFDLLLQLYSIAAIRYFYSMLQCSGHE